MFILPAVDKGLGIFPQSEPGVVENGKRLSLEALYEGTHPAFFQSFETAIAVLNISLAIQTYYALNMTDFDGEGTIFIEGGFRNNLPYLKFLGALFPKATISLTEMKEATAFGAAILAKAALDKVEPKFIAENFSIETNMVDSQEINGVVEYVREFDRLVNS